MSYMSFDKLKISHISLYTQIGIYDWEKSSKQQLIVSLTFYLQPSNKQRDLNQTIDYQQLCQKLQKYQHEKFDLIENFANTLSLYLLNQYPIVQKVKVSVHKQVILRGLPTHVNFEALRQRS